MIASGWTTGVHQAPLDDARTVFRGTATVEVVVEVVVVVVVAQ
jgi:hypothetical protein